MLKKSFNIQGGSMLLTLIENVFVVDDKDNMTKMFQSNPMTRNLTYYNQTLHPVLAINRNIMHTMNFHLASPNRISTM